MLPNGENEDIFKFDHRDIQKLSKSKSPAFYSPTFLPFIYPVKQKNKPKKKSKVIALKFITVIILIIHLISFFNFDDILPYVIKQDNYYKKILNETPNINNEIFKKKEFGITKTFLTQKIINKFNKYIEYCINNKLIDNKKYPLVLNPKISIIMPLYKGGKYLYYSLRSIQNQKMKDIEIILIDDNSPDDTLLLVNKYMKEDPRIRLIKNEINRKVLYSKSIAALNAKGKYIMQLDQDDMFIRDDVFDILYNEAENNDLDLTQIRDINKNNFHFNKKSIVNCVGKHYIYPKNNQLKEQPELKDTLFIKNNIFLLWGLLIKTDLYKKVIYHLWMIIINYQIIFHEDYTISFMLVILAKKYKYINKFALIHLNHRNSASSSHWNIKEYYLGILFFANTLYDYHIKDNPKDINISVNFIKLAKSGFKKGKSLYPNTFNIVINKILNNYYLTNKDRLYINKKFDINTNNTQFLKLNESIPIYNFQTLNSISNLNNITEIDNNINYTNISIIIVCNEYKYLEKTIDSIENQNYTNYEIILIYDNIKNYDFQLIIKYISVYPNIYIISNNEKKGYLFSISKGVLLAKGVYILTLEPGYRLAEINSLNKLHFEIDNNNVDILEFNLLVNNNENITNNSLSLYKCGHYISKASNEIYNLKFNKNIKDIDQEKELLVNKLIKANLYKNIINEYELINYNNKIYKYYDNILLFLLLNTNATFKHIEKYFVIQYINNIEILNNNEIKKDKNQIIKDSIFYINFLFEKSKNTSEDKEEVLNEFNNILSVIYNKYDRISRESQELYEKFLNCEYIPRLSKRLLTFYYHSLVN